MGVLEASTAEARKSSDFLELDEYTSVERLMKRVFHPEKARTPPETTTTPAFTNVDDFGPTIDLIEKASLTIEAYSNRCEVLQAEIDQGKAVISEQESHIDALRKMLLELKSRNAALENDGRSLKARCQSVEARLFELDQVEKAATLRASKAESISTMLRQQVEAAFGQGSPVRSAMELVKSPQIAG